MKQGSWLKIGIIGDALAPNFDEALANEMYLLSHQLNAPVLTGNNLGVMPLKRMGRYLIVNTKFLRNRTPFLSLINGAFFYPMVNRFERTVDVIYLAGGIDSGFLNYLKLGKCILIVNSIPFNSGDTLAITFARKFAPELAGIVAQSQRIRERLVKLGVEPQKIHLIYPWVNLERFNYSEPLDLEEFRILFASAPNDERADENIFERKGVPLLLEAFKEFTKHNKASLCLLWRGYYNQALYRKIRELNLESQVKVINEVVDTPGWYAQSHITVIPFLDTRRSPEIPLSAIESLACGRPLVTTDVAEIAEIVRDYGCGYVAQPRKEELVSALVKCRQNYASYQKNSRHTAEKLFNLDIAKFNNIHLTGSRN